MARIKFSGLKNTGLKNTGRKGNSFPQKPSRNSTATSPPIIQASRGRGLAEGSSMTAAVAWPFHSQAKLYWKLSGASKTDAGKTSGSIRLDRRGQGNISIDALSDCDSESRETWKLQLHSDSKYRKPIGRPLSLIVQDVSRFSIDPNRDWYEGKDKNGDYFATFTYDDDGNGVGGDFVSLNSFVGSQWWSAVNTFWRDKVITEQRPDGYVRFYTNVLLKQANGAGWDFYSAPRGVGTPQQQEMLQPPAELIQNQLPIDRKKATVVYIHGWKDSAFSPNSRQMYTNMRKAYPAHNIIMVDWAELARQVDPDDHFGEGTWATGSLQQVAESVADFLIKNCINLRTTKLIGHSYGAITASLVAKYINDNTNSILGEAIFIDYANNNYNNYSDANPYDVDARDGYGRFDDSATNWTKPPKKLMQGGSSDPKALALRTYSYHAMDLAEKKQTRLVGLPGNATANNLTTAATAGRSYHMLINNQQAGTVGMTDKTLYPPYERKIYQVPAHTGALSVFGELAKLNMLTPEAAGWPQNSLTNQIDYEGRKKIGGPYDGIIYARDPYLGTHFDQVFQKPFGWGNNVYNGTVRGSKSDDFMFFGNPNQGNALNFDSHNLNKNLKLIMKGGAGNDTLAFTKASTFENTGILEGGTGSDKFYLAAKQTRLNHANIYGLPETNKHPDESKEFVDTIVGIDDGNMLNFGGPGHYRHAKQFTVIKDLNASEGDRLFIPYNEKNIKYTTVGDYLTSHTNSMKSEGGYTDQSLAIFYDSEETNNRIAKHKDDCFFLKLGCAEDLDLLAIVSNIKHSGERPAVNDDTAWENGLLSKVNELKQAGALSFSPNHILNVDHFAMPNDGVFDSTNQASQNLYGNYVGFP